MATCPNCGRRDAMSLDRTGDTVLVAKPIGSFSLAGAQVKVSALEVEVLLLRCDPDPAFGGGCGWSAKVRLDGDQLIALEAVSR